VAPLRGGVSGQGQFARCEFKICQQAQKLDRDQK
jgi:hypothetical protein